MLSKIMACRQRRKLGKRLKDLRKAAAYRLACDADLLSPEQTGSIREILLRAKNVDRTDPAAVEKLLEESCPKIDALNPLRNGKARSLRNFLDVLSVAFGVAFGIRALYLQPFKIPTGSMQPTLFGVHYVDRAGLEKHGSFLARKIIPATSSRAYLKVARAGEVSREVESANSFFTEGARVNIGGVNYYLPGNFYSAVLRYADLTKPWYEKGEVLCDGWLVTGDHLFVERLSIHFRGIERGDVAVFCTENISSLSSQPMGGYYYIKRIAGLPGDTVRIDGKILKIRKKGETEFRPASEIDPGFAKTDSMKGGYHGHIPDGLLAEGREVTVPDNCYFALGDNTSNSFDSRNWGFIPRRNMIGLAVNVFWPISRRWGIVDTKPPIDEPTVLPYSMQIQ